MSSNQPAAAAPANGATTELTEEDKSIEMWRIRKLIENLTQARSAQGTSVISLIVPPKSQVSQISRMLDTEYGTAVNIKSRVNRLSVLDAITSTQQRLKLYSKIPDNGLVIYCGTIVTPDGKEKFVTLDMEPFKPINTSLYLCDSRFHTEPLLALLESDEKFGFIVMDGAGALFATLTGNTRDVLHRMSVDLPKKHGRGGQSALRFARLRLEKRHNYLRKVAEIATQMFITNDRPNVSGLILAGSADFKTDLAGSDMFDQRLQAVVLKVVDVAYGGDAGFNQAIELSQDCLQGVKFIREKKTIMEFFDEISQDTGKYVFGVNEVIRAMEMGAVKTLVAWENLEMSRYHLKNPTTGEEKVVYLTPEQAKDKKQFRDEATGTDLEAEETPMLEWLALNYKKFGCTLSLVSDRSPEGSQFVKGFGGVGGILRYRLDMDAINTYVDLKEGEHDDMDDFIQELDWLAM